MTSCPKFVLYCEPAELQRTNQWDHQEVFIGLGQWEGGAIAGREEAVLHTSDGYRHSTALHLTRDEVLELARQLTDVADAMGDLS